MVRRRLVILWRWWRWVRRRRWWKIGKRLRDLEVVK